jgi:hypothetical protein
MQTTDTTPATPVIASETTHTVAARTIAPQAEQRDQQQDTTLKVRTDLRAGEYVRPRY